jgi:hypothetical protein
MPVIDDTGYSLVFRKPQHLRRGKRYPKEHYECSISLSHSFFDTASNIIAPPCTRYREA